MIHKDYGLNREMEFRHAKELFGPYKNDLYWSSTRGGLIKEEEQIDKNNPKVYLFEIFCLSSLNNKYKIVLLRAFILIFNLFKISRIILDRISSQNMKERFKWTTFLSYIHHCSQYRPHSTLLLIFRLCFQPETKVKNDIHNLDI